MNETIAVEESAAVDPAAVQVGLQHRQQLEEVEATRRQQRQQEQAAQERDQEEEQLAAEAAGPSLDDLEIEL